MEDFGEILDTELSYIIKKNNMSTRCVDFKQKYAAKIFRSRKNGSCPMASGSNPLLPGIWPILQLPSYYSHVHVSMMQKPTSFSHFHFVNSQSSNRVCNKFQKFVSPVRTCGFLLELAHSEQIFSAFKPYIVRRGLIFHPYM